MLSPERKRSLLTKALGRPAFEKPAKNELVFFCPVCEHYKPKLSVNIVTDIYNCWTCNPPTKGRTLVGLLRKRVPEDMLREYMDSLGEESVWRPRQQVVVEEPPPELPDAFESLSWDYSRDITANPYINYVRRRGATEEDVRFFRLGMCRTGDLRGRVVFPSFDEQGELNFYTARKIDGEAWGQSYMTPSSSKDIIFNDCLVDWGHPVVIVEGPFDMLTVRRNAIPLQGKMLRPNSRLFERIVTSGTDVYLALDSDAMYDQVVMAHMLHRYGVRVHIVPLDGYKDINDMGRERFGRCLMDAQRYRDTDRVRLLCG